MGSIVRGFFKNRNLKILVGFPILVGILLALWQRKQGTAQPIAFNHKLHAKEIGINCNHCHTGVETGPFATFPNAEICLGCHSTPLSKNPEEAKILEYGENKREIPWKRLTRQPDFVYFSHLRHVKFGKIPCEQCHGKMEERVKPPHSAPMDLTMEDCLECHLQKGATQDCILCHR